MGKHRNSDFQVDAVSCSADENYNDNSLDDTGDDIQRVPNTDTDGVFKPMDYVPLKLPSDRIEQLRSQYDVVVVQDFDDNYHMTEAEKEKLFEFYALFKRLNNMKVRQSTLDGFVDMYRESMKCLEAVADANGVYPKHKFMDLVLSGKIEVSGLRFPIYNGPNKKNINWDRIKEYITDTELDLDDLKKKEKEARFEIVTEDQILMYEDLYFEGDIAAYLKKFENIPHEEEYPFDPDDDDPMDRNLATPLSEKESKRLVKENKTYVLGIKDYKISQRATDTLRDYAFQMTEDDFATIRNMDKSRHEDGLEVPKFTGDISNSSDVDRYLYALEQFERKHTKVEVNGRLISLDEYEELELKNVLDEDGWNLRNFYSYKEDEKKRKKKLAKIEKRKERIKKNLMKLDKKTEKKYGSGGVETKKKKHKKSSIKNEINRAVGNALAGGHRDFSDYQMSMERFDDDD